MKPKKRKVQKPAALARDLLRVPGMRLTQRRPGYVSFAKRVAS